MVAGVYNGGSTSLDCRLSYVLQDALMIRPLPRTKTGGLQKLRYALQLETETPTFVLHMQT